MFPPTRMSGPILRRRFDGRLFLAKAAFIVFLYLMFGLAVPLYLWDSYASEGWAVAATLLSAFLCAYLDTVYDLPYFSSQMLYVITALIWLLAVHP